MADWTLPTSGPIPFARKGEASPAGNGGSQLGPAPPHPSADNQPTSDQTTEIPAAEPGLAMLTSLIRRGLQNAPAHHSDAPDAPPSYASPGDSPAATALRAPAEHLAPTPPVAGLLTYQTPSAPSASHVGFEIALHRRRQLTLRLTTAEFARLHAFAMTTGSTYQSILASMVQLFLDAMTPVSAGTEDKAAVQAAVEPPAETPHPGFRPPP